MQNSRQNKPNHAPNRQAATNPSLALAVRNQQKQRRPARKVNRPQKQKKQIVVRQEHKSMPECAVVYASALCDPEGTPEGACVPYGFPTPSMKQKVFTRGTFALGTTGQGFIMFNPNTTNDGVCITSTGTTSVGTAATALNAFTNPVTTALTKLMFSTADVVTNTNVASRIVAGCIKIRYSGTEANRNGTMTALEEPNHRSLAARTGTEIRGYINSFVERPDPLGSFFSTNLSGPVTALETQFQNIATPYGNCIVIFVDGLASDKYEFEVYQHVEYSGQNIPGASASHADPVAYAQIMDVTKAVTVSEPLSEKNGQSTFRKIVSMAGASLKSLLKEHGPDIAGMVSQILLPGSGFITRGLVGGLQRKPLAIKG